jgi:hypothetical protein
MAKGQEIWYMPCKEPVYVNSFKTVAREFAWYKLDLICIQELRRDKGCTVRAGDFIFFYGKGNENHKFGTGFFNTTEYYQQLQE